MATPIQGLKAMRIGCDGAVIAKLTADTGAAKPTWGAVQELPGVMVINVNPNSSIETAFYDDGPGEAATTLGNIEVSFDKSSLGPSETAFLLGKELDSNGVLWHGSNDTPPWVAFGFRSLKSDGTYKYVWLYKGKFIDPSSNNETKGESVNFQNDQITGRFVKLNWEYTVSDAANGSTVNKKVKPWKVELDETDAPTITELNKKWFAAVVEPDKTFTA